MPSVRRVPRDRKYVFWETNEEYSNKRSMDRVHKCFISLKKQHTCTKKIQNIVHRPSKSLNQQGRVCLGVGFVACLSYHSSIAISYQNHWIDITKFWYNEIFLWALTIRYICSRLYVKKHSEIIVVFLTWILWLNGDTMSPWSLLCMHTWSVNHIFNT